MTTVATPSPSDQQRATSIFWITWATVAAFGSYFCMYGFRKPFTAGEYHGSELWGLGYKSVLITAQILGYTVSKFMGIKFVAEMLPRYRAVSMLVLVLIAELALILFGLVPEPWNVACLFLNGLPLGMVFGMVLGFLEGRRLTELLTAGLCASFILADGVTKSVGAGLLTFGISEKWMPALAGALYLAPFCIFTAMLAIVPPPTTQDIAARSQRCTMSRSARWSFIRRYATGLLSLVLMYLVVTIIRSIRADFAPEIWAGLGAPAVPGMFTYSETFVTLGVLVVNGGAVLITDNRKAFFASLITCGLGLCLLAVTLLAHYCGTLSPLSFMVLIGLGLYLPYVACHTTVFERMLGMTREPGNLGFLMYFADAIGYLGYVGVILSRNFVHRSVSKDMLGLLTVSCWLAIGISGLCLIISWRYFAATVSSNSVALTKVGV